MSPMAALKITDLAFDSSDHEVADLLYKVSIFGRARYQREVHSTF